MEILGWMGSVLLALCGLPQAIQTVRTKSASDISWLFLLMWGAGDLMLLIYTFPLGKLALTINYGFNAVLISIIIWYKHKEDL